MESLVTLPRSHTTDRRSCKVFGPKAAIGLCTGTRQHVPIPTTDSRALDHRGHSVSQDATTRMAIKLFVCFAFCHWFPFEVSERAWPTQALAS